MAEVSIAPEVKRLSEAAIKSKSDNGGQLHFSKMKELVSKENLEFLGGGGECLVVNKSGDPEKVVALEYRDVPIEDQKGNFYRQRIMEALFPHNFPHFYSVINGVTVRQRINSSEGDVKYSFFDVAESIDSMELPVWIDNARFNFMVGEDGGEYYVDKVDSDMGEWKMDKIKAFVDERKIPVERLEIIEKSIERLKALGQD